jgi:hypothetical protein
MCSIIPCSKYTSIITHTQLSGELEKVCGRNSEKMLQILAISYMVKEECVPLYLFVPYTSERSCIHLGEICHFDKEQPYGNFRHMKITVPELDTKTSNVSFLERGVSS